MLRLMRRVLTGPTMLKSPPIRPRSRGPFCFQSTTGLCTAPPRIPKYPTQDQAAKQTRFYHEMEEAPLLIMASYGDTGARRERFVREIMYIDALDWRAAASHADRLAESEVQGHIAQTLTTAVGVSSIVFGLGSLPMVFHLETALWFNDRYVTTDVPEAKDLETWLEVGQWTWSWMEPPIGTLSFVFLAFQFARGRGIVFPLEEFYMRRRAQSLLQRYPRYSPLILLQWAESLSPGQDYSPLQAGFCHKQEEA